MNRCSRCGKEQTDVTGIELRLIVQKDESGERIKANEEVVKSQLGKYWRDKDEHVFTFCFECWIDSLMGVKEIE